MNPLTNVKNIAKLNEQELKLGIGDSCSWHKIYKHSPWIFIGGLDYDLTEGDVICVFSQYGEVEDINLVRDKKTGKSKGFCFLCYQNKTSTTLAVDNLNGIKLCGRTIRVDHVADYRPPKEGKGEEGKGLEDSTAFLKPLLQNSLEIEKPRYKDKDKQHKESATEQTMEKHDHKGTKNYVPKEIAVDNEKPHRHHHRARDLPDEKPLKGNSSRHDKHRKRRHSSSEESIQVKQKPRKAKYKEVKLVDRKQNSSDSSSDESGKRTKHKSKHKHKKHKHKESRH